MKNLKFSVISATLLLIFSVFASPIWGFEESTKLIPIDQQSDNKSNVKLILPDKSKAVTKNLSEAGRLILNRRSFHQAYETLVSEWIFLDGERVMLERAGNQIAADSGLSKPKLDHDSAENLALIESFLDQAMRNDPSDAEEITRNAITAMFKIDQFSHVLLDWQLKMFLFEPGDEYIGDGLIPDIEDKRLSVFITIPGTPADEAGFLPGDTILKINDISFDNVSDQKDMDSRLQQLNPDHLYVTIGAKITYNILRDNGDSTERMTINTVVIKRGIAQEKQTVISQQTGDIGTLIIKEFNKGTGKLFVRKLNELVNNGIKGLIIDVRDNPGGFVSETLIIVKSLTGKGFILTGKKDYQLIDNNDLPGPLFSGPIVVLINGNSASASEITAACLREHGAVIFGQTSYGKNCGQSMIVLPNRNFLLYTNLRVTTLGGKTWPNGIKPDYSTSTGETYSRAKTWLEEKIKSK